MPYPDRFYPVVDSVAWVARLTDLGVGTIQLRAKNLDDARFIEYPVEGDVVRVQHKLANPDRQARATFVTLVGRRLPVFSST